MAAVADEKTPKKGKRAHVTIERTGAQQVDVLSLLRTKEGRNLLRKMQKVKVRPRKHS